MEPVGSSTPLGYWHAASSAVTRCSSEDTKPQKRLLVFVPCLKSNMPGPSVVPAANESPIAAMHVLPRGVPLASATGRPGILMYAWTNPTSPAISRPLIDCVRSPRAVSTCRSAMMRVESNMSTPGPDEWHSSERCRPRMSLQVEWSVSQGWPAPGPPTQTAPRVFGETSPRAEAAKAATKLPCPGRASSEVGPLISRSSK
mmetsp:Transcript_23294/g.53914  ORF Transcript_23294/g.53914 Transcript_23294/m.53914 type:complete len:201 (-) Transcript_23294:132-734(-)